MDKEDDLTSRLNKLLEKQEKLKKRRVKSKPKKAVLKKSVAEEIKPINKSKPAVKKTGSIKESNSKIKMVKEKKSAKKTKTLLPVNEKKIKSGSNLKSKFMSLFKRSTPTNKVKPTAKEIINKTKQEKIGGTITKETKPIEIKKSTTKEKRKTTENKSVNKNETSKTKGATTEELIIPLKKKCAKKSENKLLETITVSEVMKRPEVMDIESPVVEVVRMFSEKKCNGIFISKKEKIAGLIILQDILEVLMKKKKIVKLKAGDIMKDFVGMNKGDNLSKAILSMHVHRSNCVAVMDHKNVVGVVTRSRILNKLAKNIFATEDNEIIGNIIETKVDRLLDLLKKKETNMKELEAKLDIDGEKIEEWLEILKIHKIIKYKKSLFGKMQVEYVK